MSPRFDAAFVQVTNRLAKPYRRRRDARIASTVIGELASRSDAVRGWRLHKIVPTVSHTSVAFVGPESGVEGVLKVARTAESLRALRRQNSTVTQLRDDPRLAQWSHLLPDVMLVDSVRAFDGALAMVEEFRPGVELAAMGSRQADMVGKAAVALQPMHALTAQPRRLSPADLERHVAEPAALVRDRSVVNGANARQLAALDRLEQLLAGGLSSSPIGVGWIHGDYGPTNVLVDASSGEVTSIIDWEDGASDGICALDIGCLLIAARAMAAGVSIGVVVADVVRTGWTESEMATIESASEAIPGFGATGSELALLAWLHLCAMKARRRIFYPSERRWWMHNVEPVLDLEPTDGRAECI